MTRPCVFGLGLAAGAWSVIAAMHFAARYAGRHMLDIATKENR